MPDSDVSRMTASVPSCSGAYGSATLIFTAAWLLEVSEMAFTLPTGRPPICTLSPFTSCPAFSKISVYSCPSPRSRNSHAAKRTTMTTPMATDARASVPRLLPAQRTLRGPGKELVDELVVGVEQLFGRAGLDDPALPQHGDVLRDALGRHDVVRDHDVGPAVLLVDLLDQLAQQRGADRSERAVGLVEEHDVGIEHERAREAGALAHPARELVGHLVVGALEADLAQAPRDDLLDLVLALVRVLAQREADVVEQVHRAEEGAVLEQDAELLAHLEEVVVGHVRHGLAVDEHVAVVGIEQPDHVIDADGLARARRAQDHRDLPLGDAHVEAAQDLVAAERLVDLDELDGVRDSRRALGAGVPLVLVVGVALAPRRLEAALVLGVVLGAWLGLDRGVRVLALGLRVAVVAVVALLARGRLRRRLRAVAAVLVLVLTEEASHVCLRSTADGCAWVGAPEELRPKHSDEVHEHDVQHHGLGRGGSHPDRAAARVVPVVAAHEHDAGRHRHALNHAV